MKTIEELIKNRDDFLIKHPELQGIQDRIDKTLEGVTDPIERCKILNELTLQSSRYLVHKIDELFDIVNNTDLDSMILGLREEFKGKE